MEMVKCKDSESVASMVPNFYADHPQVILLEVSFVELNMLGSDVSVYDK